MQWFYATFSKRQRRKQREDLEDLHDDMLKKGVQAARVLPRSFWSRPRAKDVEKVQAFVQRRANVGSHVWPPIRAAHPFGLAAGMDKNCTASDLWRKIGAGSVEYGTVTPKIRDGNPRPRIWMDDKNVLHNRMGLPNDGFEAVLPRFRRAAARHERDYLDTSAGVSISAPREDLQATTEVVGAATTSLSLADQELDALLTMARSLGVLPDPDFSSIDEELGPTAAATRPGKTTPAEHVAEGQQQKEVLEPPLPAWVTINLSCPNLTHVVGEEASLDVRTLEWLAEVGRPLINGPSWRVPLLFKMPRGATTAQRQFAEAIANRVRRDPTARLGLVLSNAEVTATGAKSGTAEMLRSTRETMQRLHAFFNVHGVRDRVILVASGGVTTPQAAVDLLFDGADHIQVYSGLVEYGPAFFRDATRLAAETIV